MHWLVFLALLGAFEAQARYRRQKYDHQPRPTNGAIGPGL